MDIALINPANGLPLEEAEGALVDAEGHRFPIVRQVPRICDPSNYTANFGKQWNLFRATQIDRPTEGQTQSEQRFFETTGWTAEEMDGEDVLEVGSGAGRFSRVVLERTRARLWSVDYSSAVEANYANNAGLGGDRFRLFQASIYELPFPDGSFDKVFCMGVLQHTPDFEASVRALIAKAKPGGQIAVDFYPVKGFWTKLHAKYLLRPLTKRMSHERLLKLIEANVGWMMGLSRALSRVRLGALNRFIPLVDMDRVMPGGLAPEQRREWAVLDTFDMFSPEYDNPQRVARVAKMFRDNGAEVTFAGFRMIGASNTAIVRGVRK
ncbi:MAG: class I SAM-dependent methyltransferase [Alphaproteobacteria bacterium]|nr:class I SAM-dependent methyltransferase [Alphaproteobacteria bacterium]